MTWAAFHAESERLAIEAQLALKERRASDALILYRRAAEAEKQALDSVEAAKSRTRGVTGVSAVALWFKAGEYTLAEQLAHGLLAEAAIPEFARENLRDLVQAIWTESAKQKAGVSFVPGQVTVSVKGGEVVTGGAPLDLIIDKVQTIQSLFYRTIELLNGMTHRGRGRPSKELQDSCRPWLFQAAPGSYQFSVAIQKPTQADFFRQEVEPERIAQHFLEIVGASAGDDFQQLEKLVPDEKYRTTFLKLTRNLSPTGKSFDQIDLRTSGEVQPISLNVDSRTHINHNLRPKESDQIDVKTESSEALHGILRALHLDDDWLEVVVNGVSHHVNGLAEAVDDVIGPMVNKTVVVHVVRSTKNKLKYVDIELAE